MSELPKGWCLISLFNISQPKQWKTISKKDLLPEGFTVYGANGIIGRYSCFTHEKPTIMITCRGASCGNIHKSLPKSYINGNAMALDSLYGEINIDYLYYYLRSVDFKEIISGSAQPQITKEGLQNLNVLLPPQNEQIRIANKLDSLLANVNAAQAHLDKIPTLLKRFRQSVLAAATSGALTNEWRSQDNENWKQVFLEELISSSVNGLSKRNGKSGIETTILRLADFKGAKRVFGNERKIKLNDKELEKYSLNDGDILVIRVNGSVELAGRFVRYNTQNDIEGFCDHFIRLRLKEQILPTYLTFVANESDGRRYLKASLSTSAGQNTINQSSVKGLRISLPPIKEQTEIVRRVESLFALADTIEQQYLAAKKRTDRLTQSLLAKAFRGELVPQDPNDEPASQLLKRIEAERAAQRPAKKAGKTKRSTSDKETAY